MRASRRWATGLKGAKLWAAEGPDGMVTLYEVSEAAAAKLRVVVRTHGRSCSPGQKLCVLNGSGLDRIQDSWPGLPPEPALGAGHWGVLSPDGLAYAPVPGGEEILAMLGAPDPYYGFGEGVSVHMLQLKANDVPLLPDKAATNAQFIVGQQITFSSAWVQASPYNGEPPGLVGNTNKWDFTGNYKNDQSSCVPGGHFVDKRVSALYELCAARGRGRNKRLVGFRWLQRPAR